MSESVMSDQSTIKVDSPHWGIFEPDMIDVSNEEYEWIQYKELNVTNTVGLTRYELETRDKEAYILPHDGYLEIETKIVQADGTAIPATDKIAFQNCLLSLMKDADYYIEDQLIEHLDNPGQAYLMKNISDFSKQHETIASNEGFYLDTFDKATLQYCNLRFFDNTGARAGYELYFAMNATPDMAATVAAAADTWQAGDAVVPRVEISPGVFKDVILYSNASFHSAVPAVGTVRPVTIEANGLLTLTDLGANNDFIRAFIDDGTEITFLGGDVVIRPQQNGAAGAPRPIDALTAAGAAVAANTLITGYIQSKPDLFNVGFSKRKARTAQSKVDYAWIPLKNIFQFARHYQKCSRGLRHKLIFNRNSDQQALFKFGNHADRTFQITGISMWIPRLKGSLEVVKKLENKLVSGASVDVNFTDLTWWKTTTTQTGGSDKAVNLATTSKRPVRVWVAFQYASRYDGGQQTNKRVFDNLQISQIEVRLNGRKYPTMAYRFPNPTTTLEGYNRVYAMLMNAGYKMKDHDEGSLLDLETFYKLYNIFYFDLTAQEEGLFDSVKYSELEVRWSNPANVAPYYMICLYESERKLKMSGLNGSLAIAL